MADNYTIKDGNNIARTMRAKDIAGAMSNRIIPQVADADVSTSNPMPIVFASSPTLPTGASTAVNQTDQQTLMTSMFGAQTTGLTAVGAVNEAVPATDTAASGLNGRLQRLAQKFTDFLSRLPVSIGQKSAANSLAVVLASDQLVLSAGNFTVASSTLTRASGILTYASGQLIGQNASAAGCNPVIIPAARVISAAGRIRRVSIKVNDSAWLAATVRVHFFQAVPVFLVGDGTAIAGQLSEASYVGSCDVVLDQSFSATIVKGWTALSGVTEVNFLPDAGTQNIYAVLEARSAVTAAASKTFTLTLETNQN